MKYLLSLFLLLSASLLNAETIIHYTHVYDIDENGAKLEVCKGADTYLVFNDGKSQFYESDNPTGTVKGSPAIYKFEKTVNGIHYYYHDIDYETRRPEENLMPWDPRYKLEYARIPVLRNIARENLKFSRGRIYVYFSNDFSKINWFVLDKGNKEYYVYEKYKEPAKRQAPSSLY